MGDDPKTFGAWRAIAYLCAQASGGDLAAQAILGDLCRKATQHHRDRQQREGR